MRKIHLPLLLVATAVATAACTKPSGDAQSDASGVISTKPAVATVNGKDISGDLYDIFLEAITNGQPDSLTDDQKSQALDQLISMWLAADVAKTEGMTKDPAIQARLELLRLQVLAEASTSKYAEAHPISDDEVRAEFDTQVAGMAKEYKARHILVDDEADAIAIIADIQGGKDFAKIAKEKSKDSGSAENGGELGWFSPNTMVPPFADAVVALEKGKMTLVPVKSDFGWHIILLEDTREPEAPDFDQVKPQVESLVRRKKLQEYLDQLRSQADIQKKI
jgi:peptidyl-prolyl cis-trans isomerase C